MCSIVCTRYAILCTQLHFYLFSDWLLFFWKSFIKGFSDLAIKRSGLSVRGVCTEMAIELINGHGTN